MSKKTHHQRVKRAAQVRAKSAQTNSNRKAIGSTSIPDSEFEMLRDQLADHIIKFFMEEMPEGSRAAADLDPKIQIGLVFEAAAEIATHIGADPVEKAIVLIAKRQDDQARVHHMIDVVYDTFASLT